MEMGSGVMDLWIIKFLGLFFIKIVYNFYVKFYLCGKFLVLIIIFFVFEDCYIFYSSGIDCKIFMSEVWYC